jgi:hypothetical protein
LGGGGVRVVLERPYSAGLNTLFLTGFITLKIAVSTQTKT